MGVQQAMGGQPQQMGGSSPVAIVGGGHPASGQQMGGGQHMGGGQPMGVGQQMGGHATGVSRQAHTSGASYLVPV
jgi:hypothetical protein